MIFPGYDENGKIKHNGWRYTAIKELKGRLEELGISHEMHETLDGYQICVPADHELNMFEGDVIQHYGSYGVAANLLEVYGFNLNSPDGCLTVDEALQYFIKWDKERGKA